MMKESQRDILVRLLNQANQILVFTGAGVSTGSGISDYRGPAGVWTRRQPVYYEYFMASEQARIEYWDYKLEAWSSFKDARPNITHKAIVELEQANKVVMVITQNVDGLHAKAGTSPEHLVELHGTNLAIECQSCLERSDPGPHFEYFEKARKAPVCRCGGFLKPATISFGQSLRQEDLSKASAAAQQADLVIALGSTLSVHPAASIPLVAAERDVPYVVINRGETDHDRHRAVSLRLEGDVAEIFSPAVVQALETLKNVVPQSS